MNKNDIKLIIIVFTFSILMFIIIYFNRGESNYAYVYRKDELIKKIDLNKSGIYEVDGKNGVVKIEVNNKRIRVKDENSKYNLCSKQGYISDKNSSIICLPNEIYIKLESNLDTISR